MKQIRLLIASAITIVFLNSNVAEAQLIIDNTTYVNPTPVQSLVQNILLGQGINASNFTFTGDPQQIAYFKSTNTNLGLDSGIVISSGNTSAIAAAGSGFASTAYQSTVGDVDLTTFLQNSPIGPQDVNDVAIIEFDFVPLGDSVKFDYVFGSEEYPDFVCSYNDVFGLFISGPGITGPYANNAANIALVPGTGQEVSIVTINGGSPNGTCNWENQNNQFYVDNAAGTDVVYDGFTTVLTARAQVVCGQTYHVKMALCDAGDWSYDSGIFLRAKSFISQAVSVQAATISGDSTIVEGCSQAAFSFYRPGDLSDSLVLNYTLSGTALEGVDYNILPDSIVFVPGQDLVTVPIIPVDDAIAEGPESITITFTQDICGLVTQSSTLWIVPITPIIVSAPDTSIVCPNTPITLQAQFSGGYPPYTVVWSTGDTANSVTVNPGNVTTTYYYAVSDTCSGIAVTDSITVNVSPGLPLTVIGSDICIPLNGTGTLTANGSGGFPPYSYIWLLSGNFVGFNQDLVITGIQDTIYVVRVYDGCGSLFSIDSVYVTIGDPVNLSVITTAPDQSIVEGCGSGIFQFSRPGSAADTLYLPITIGGTATLGTDYNTINDTIVFLPGETQIQISISALTDGLTESNESIIISYNQVGCGAPSIDSILIYPLAPITTNAQSTYTLVCPGDNVTLNSSFVGGYPPYNIVWNTSETTSSIVVNPSTTATYTYTVTDSCNSQSATQTITVNVPVATPITATSFANDILCPDSTSLVAATASGGFPSYTYSWTLNGNPVATTSSFTTSALSQNTTYVVTINDACGSTPLQQNVVVNVFPYTAMVMTLGSDLTLPCPNVPASIDATISNGLNPYEFEWSTGAVPNTNDSSIAAINPSVPGIYYLNVTDACQQVVSDTVQVSIASYNALTAVASQDTTVCPGNPITLSVIADGGAGSYSYLWQDMVNPVTFAGDTSVSIAPIIDYTVTYRITVTDFCGNTVFDEVQVPLRTDCDVTVPNIITPNGDGENQYLVFENLELFPQPKLEVFNRWGTRVFESDNYQNNWAPTDLNPGVYFFTLELGTIDPKKGFFQLMK